ncbi:MAG: HEAT repeat domain-containing protein [candidate division WOR-3 bacterium]|nr:HEAT repeat domain-containing protein [candidate division WOR-3 bacterium]MCX7836902.1 HEAT repeat domain-containing protein [candidate division WOR-3 bacterium]MDW8114622.1 HEAT repeat domain-containing protein [candidate division WOR-3 bacterium]
MDDIERLKRELFHPEISKRLKAIEELAFLKTAPAIFLLLETLARETNTIIREKINEELLKIGKRVVPYILEMLKIEREKVKSLESKKIEKPVIRIFCQLLARLEAKESEDILIELLKDEDPLIKTSACEALGILKSKKAIENIFPLLYDLNFWVRACACAALGEIGDEKALPHLLEKLKDESHWVRSSACEALGKIGDKKAGEALAYISLYDESEIVREAAIKALTMIGEAIISPYLNALMSDDLNKRLKAMEILIKEGKIVLYPLLSLLNNPSIVLKTCICEILGKIGDERAIEGLANLFNDRDINVRIAAVNALANIKSEKTCSYLLDLLSSPNSTIADLAKRALTKLGEKSVNILLNELIKIKEEEKRIKIIEILGDIKNKESIEVLLEICKERNSLVRFHSALAISKIVALPPIEKRKEIINTMLELLKDELAIVRATALEVLGILRADEVFEEIIKMLEDPETSVKRKAIWAISEIGGKRAVDILRKAINSEESIVKIEVINSLIKLKDKEALPLLKKIARPWPFSKEDGEVKKVAKEGIQILKSLE